MVVGVLELVYFSEHLDLMDSTLDLGCMLLVDFTYEAVDVYDAMGELRFSCSADTGTKGDDLIIPL